MDGRTTAMVHEPRSTEQSACPEITGLFWYMSLEHDDAMRYDHARVSTDREPVRDMARAFDVSVAMI
jgi:hypothetical protein